MRSAVHFQRLAQQTTEPQAKQEVRSVLCHSLMIDLKFEQSENVTISYKVSQAAALGMQ